MGSSRSGLSFLVLQAASLAAGIVASPPDDDRRAARGALDVGVRHIDCARRLDSRHLSVLDLSLIIQAIP